MGAITPSHPPRPRNATTNPAPVSSLQSNRTRFQRFCNPPRTLSPGAARPSTFATSRHDAGSSKSAATDAAATIYFPLSTALAGARRLVDAASTIYFYSLLSTALTVAESGRKRQVFRDFSSREIAVLACFPGWKAHTIQRLLTQPIPGSLQPARPPARRPRATRFVAPIAIASGARANSLPARHRKQSFRPYQRRTCADRPNNPTFEF